MLLVTIHLIMITLFCVAMVIAQAYFLTDTLLFHRAVVKFICLNLGLLLHFNKTANCDRTRQYCIISGLQGFRCNCDEYLGGVCVYLHVLQVCSFLPPFSKQ